MEHSYELVRLLAQGGMADVYLARLADVPVVLKVLNDEYANSAEARLLFAHEARLARVLRHQNLATVYGLAHERYLAMEYVDGANLCELLAIATHTGCAITYECAIAIAAAAARGLDHAHRLGVVHRDVSLSNIMVRRDGVVKVIDFGIARSRDAVHVTNPGTLRGKPSYMSPEQCLGNEVDRRTDVFALGIVLYELATGRPCFVGTTSFARMVAIVHGEYISPSRYDARFPAGLERVIRKALAVDPADRYQSAAQLGEALRDLARAYAWSSDGGCLAKLMADLLGEEPGAGDFDDETYVGPPPFAFAA